MTESAVKSAKSVNEYLNGIPAIRWRIIALRTEHTEDQILNSPALTMAIAANEKHREIEGRDDYPRFLNMGLGDLEEYLTAGTAVLEDQGEDQGDELPDGEEEDTTDVGRFPVADGGSDVAAEQSPIRVGHADSTE